MAVATPKKKEELAHQFKINPEINTKLEAFMEANKDLVKYVKELTRERVWRVTPRDVRAPAGAAPAGALPVPAKAA